MEGKTIMKTLELENGYHLLLLSNDSVILMKVVSSTIQADELAELVGEPGTEEAKPEKDKAPDPEPEDENDGDITLEDLQGMNYKKLSKFCEKNDLGVDPEDFDEDEEPELRQAIAKELELEADPDPEPETGDDDKAEADPDTADDDYTWDDLEKMDYDELKELCDENDTDTDPDDFDEDEEVDFRRAIAKEFGIEAPKKKKKKKK